MGAGKWHHWEVWSWPGGAGIVDGVLLGELPHSFTPLHIMSDIRADLSISGIRLK